MYLWYVKTHGKILLHFLLVNMKNKISELSSVMVNKVLIVFACQGRTLFSSVQLLSCVRLFWDPMDCSTPGLPVHHQLPEFTQTYGHWVSDAIQPSHTVVPFSSRLSLSQHQIPVNGIVLVLCFLSIIPLEIISDAIVVIVPKTV